MLNNTPDLISQTAFKKQLRYKRVFGKKNRDRSLLWQSKNKGLEVKLVWQVSLFSTFQPRTPPTTLYLVLRADSTKITSFFPLLFSSKRVRDENISLRYRTRPECCTLGDGLVFCKRCGTFILNLQGIPLKRCACAFPKAPIGSDWVDYIKVSLTGHCVIKTHG